MSERPFNLDDIAGHRFLTDAEQYELLVDTSLENDLSAADRAAFPQPDQTPVEYFPTPAEDFVGQIAEFTSKLVTSTYISFDHAARGTIQGFYYNATRLKAGNGQLVSISSNMLNVLLELDAARISTRVSFLLSCRHSSANSHFSGRGCDIGNDSNSDLIYTFLYENKNRLSLDELISMTPPVGTKNLKNGAPFDYNSTTLTEYKNYIHFSTSF